MESDEEGEVVPDCVTNFHFLNDEQEPISFSMLPLQWVEDQRPEGSGIQVFLCGTADDGLRSIFKKVTAWKFELCYVQPEIYVLSKEEVWINLQKPRKSYKEIIKSVLVAVHCLHFLKKHPGESGEAMWNKMQKTFSIFEDLPCENDLLEHMPLLNKAAERDEDIARSEYLATFFLKKTGKSKDFPEKNCSTKKSRFIVDVGDNDIGGYDDDNCGGYDDDDDDDNENDLFDHVCAFCDNGGEVLCCEGRCIRSFHPTVDSGCESSCESLGYTHSQVAAIKNFLCKNCRYQQHQCFACGTLGSSDRSSSGEVFPCISATCGHFYHPKCVAELIHPRDKIQAEGLQKKIVSGESFLCPVHECCQCKGREDKVIYELQFAICRRCPKAYHRKCLPRAIDFGSDADRCQRAWEGLLPNRILIYCMDHKIIPQIGTPKRDHILFPEFEGRKQPLTSGPLSTNMSVRASKSLGTWERMVTNLKRPLGAMHSDVKGGTCTQEAEKGPSRIIPEPKITAAMLISNYTNLSKKVPKPSAEVKSKLACKSDEFQSVLSMRHNTKWESVPNQTWKTSQTVKPSNYTNPFISKKVLKPPTVVKNKSSFKCDESKSVLSMRKNTELGSKSDQTQKTLASNLVMKKANSTRPSNDAEFRKRMEAFMKNATSSFESEELIKNKKRKGINAYCPKFGAENILTIGKVAGSVEAVRVALTKLEGGCTVEEAKAVCEPEILNEIIRWKRKLSVFLAPFLHGMRYTSFGRHFTKLDKLKEVVNRLRWYVQDGDTIVDFCCGSNDFSCLMKEELDRLGKDCSFKNFDLIQPKKDFNFEQRDWMTVRGRELPSGSNLIMGLNPPFGVQASLANKFIDKALTFKPKLLILIVPKETERLDEKRCPYDLIWEDDVLLAGKSFYLPGSLDKNDQQMDQWNMEAPPLYLWSRQDWTGKHRAIARKHGHITTQQGEGMNTQTIDDEPAVSNYLMEEKLDCFGDFSNVASGYTDLTKLLDDIPEVSDDNELESLA